MTTLSNGSENTSAPPSSYATEFAVDMTCGACEKKVREALANVSGIESVQVDVPSKQVIVQGYARPSTLLQALRTTGLRAAVQGQGEHAAVCVLGSHAGVARLVALSADRLWVDLAVNPAALPGRVYRVAVMATGDLSDPDLGRAPVAALGTVAPHTGDPALCTAWPAALASWIGRALCLQAEGQGHQVCGVIARSAGALQNEKKVCTCSGKTIWEDTL